LVRLGLGMHTNKFEKKYSVDINSVVDVISVVDEFSGVYE
jgi:hypothetical protein